MTLVRSLIAVVIAGEPGEEHDRIGLVEQRRDIGTVGRPATGASSPAIESSSRAFRMPSFEAKRR